MVRRLFIRDVKLIWLQSLALLAAYTFVAILLPLLTHPVRANLVPILFGPGMGSASPALTAWMLRLVPPGERAVAINTFTLLTEGSGFLSSWLVGAFLQSGSLSRFLTLAGLLGLGLIVYGMVPRAANSLPQGIETG